jgi:LPXTG-motif cell wall-anchored protein
VKVRRSLSAAALALLAGGSLLVLAGPRAEAQILPVPPQPAPVTDYANYPANNGLPPGCDANGVVGVTFTVNGGAPVANLQDIDPINAGDVVVMSWTDVLPVCGDPVNPGPIVLAMKSAKTGSFDPGTDQALDLPYAIGWLYAGQPGSVTYVLPPLNDDSFPGCFGQLDAVTGLPLFIVGPGGSFYSYNVPWDMLISSWNGGYPECETQETTTTTGGTTSTTEGTTTTSTPESTTTTAPTTTTEAPTTTAPSSLTTAPSTTVTDPTSLTVGVQAAQTTRTLAATGRSSGWAALAGAIGIGLGVVLLVVSRRRAHA